MFYEKEVTKNGEYVLAYYRSGIQIEILSNYEEYSKRLEQLSDELHAARDMDKAEGSEKWKYTWGFKK